MNNIKLALAALFSLFLVSGCHKDSSSKNQDPLDESYQLLDRGQYSAAIQSLHKLMQTDARPQVRVALASAYAARGGVRVEQYWGFVIGFKAPLVTTDPIKINDNLESFRRISKQLKGEINSKDMKILGGVLEALAFWDRYQERIDAIPLVQGAALEDVRRAIEVLSRVQTPGGRLYRGILNLIVFKSYVVASEKVWGGLHKSAQDLLAGKIEVLCQIDYEQVIGWIKPLSYHLIETMADISVAFPEEGAALIDARKATEKLYDSLNEGLEELRQKRACP